MKNGLYVVYDKVACESGPVFEAKNDAVAIRHFGLCMAKCSDTTEFKLLKVAEIDHDTNVIVGSLIPDEIEVNLKNSEPVAGHDVLNTSYGPILHKGDVGL